MQIMCNYAIMHPSEYKIVQLCNMNENWNKIKVEYSKNLHPFDLVVRLAIFYETSTDILGTFMNVNWKSMN